ncbi:MAG TPA: hypothetical protein VHL99_08160 [Candidatus Binatia bacterium]|jgi:hypothetical protein|nr:hypothetical protein [Candidatus Binatia bacterium]
MPNGKLRFAILLLACCLLGAPAVAADAPKPRDDVAQTILIMDGPRGKECAERKVVKIEVLEADRDKKPVVERWTLDRCGKPVNYLVKYLRAGKDFDVQLEK